MRYLGLPVISLLSLVLLGGCSKPEKATENPAAPSAGPAASAASDSSHAAAPVPVDKNTVGTVSGTIAFKGAIPKFPPLDMTQDPGCPPDPQAAEVVAVNHGHLANVFVYVKDGLSAGANPASPEPVVLDQKGCRYVPHVLGLMVGQPLKVLNSDTAGHNVHPMPQSDEDSWNESQMPRGAPIVRAFRHSQIMMPVQCNQHPWMKAYISVMPNPYFAVSAADGTFEIDNLPPGEYTLAAVHEKFGEQTIKIKVAAKETANADFAFAPAK